MEALETLQVVIEADTHALEGTIKTSFNKIQGLVDVLNSNEINWKKIMTQSISPAMISGIAAVFALALTSALSFQDSVSQVGQDLGLTGDSLAVFNDDVIKIAETTGISSGEIAKAMGKSIPIFENQADAMAYVMEVAKLSAIGYGNMADIIDSTIPIIQDWGATSQEASDSVMKSLLSAAQVSGKTIDTIANNFGTFSDKLIFAGMKVGDLSGLLINFGAQIKNVGLDNATQEFDRVAKAMGSAGDPLNSLVGGMDRLRDIVKNQGIDRAIADIGNAISKKQLNGENITEIADAFGMSVRNVNGFTKAAQNFSSINSDLKTMLANIREVNDAFRTQETVTQKLKGVFITIRETVGQVMRGAGEYLKNLVMDPAQTVSDTVAGLKETGVTGLLGGFGGADTLLLGTTLQKSLMDMFKGGSSADVINSSGSGKETSKSSGSGGNVTVNQYFGPAAATPESIKTATTSALQANTHGY